MESLCSLIKSTVTVVAGRVRLTALPVEGVREIPVMVTTNERMLVPGGGTRGRAASVALTLAEPCGPQFVVQRVFGPLQEATKRAAKKRVKERAFRQIIEDPTTE